MWRRFFFGVVVVFLLETSPARAELGLYGLGGKIGLDVVQANDTRHFWVLQADVASVFTPRLHLDIAGEVGSGTDLDNSEIKVVGGGAYLKYLWPSKSRRAFAYMGGGFAVTRIERTVLGQIEHAKQLVMHLILVGMEKHAFRGRMKGIFEIRWVIGDEEDASSLRAAVGIGVNIKKP
ncbi:MAG: hypothetical protein O7G87_22395 [bacterium]|nr:hypothetical protein [bacterium]